MTHTRIISLDIARVICIILVVIGHFYPETATPEYGVFRQWIYAFHMPVFFFVSGYVFLKYHDFEQKIGHFFQKKVRRLVLPYFVTSFFVIALKLVTQKSGNIDNPVSIWSFLKVFYRPEAGYYLWFIWSLFSIFLIVPWCKTAKSRLLLLLLSIVAHYTIVLLEIADCDLSFFIFDLFSIKQTIRMFLWFVLGMWSVDLNWNLKFSDRTRNAILLLMIGFSVWFCFYPVYDEHNIPAAILPYLGVCSVLILADSLSKKSQSVKTAFISLSSATFFIYLFHTTFMGFAKSFLSKISIFHSDIGFYAEALLVVIVGLITPYIIYRLLIGYIPSLKKYI